MTSINNLLIYGNREQYLRRPTLKRLVEDKSGTSKGGEGRDENKEKGRDGWNVEFPGEELEL